MIRGLGGVMPSAIGAHRIPGPGRTRPKARGDGHPVAVLEGARLDELQRVHALEVAQHLGATGGAKPPRDPPAVRARDREGLQLTGGRQGLRGHHDDGGLPATGHLLAIGAVAMVGRHHRLPGKCVAELAAEATASL